MQLFSVFSKGEMAKIVTMWLKSGLVYLFLVLFLDFGYCRRPKTNSNCPENCFCNTISKIVYCSRRGLTVIPDKLAEGTKQLNLNGNLFDVPILQKSNFTKATELLHLYMSECGIEKIEVGAFEGMVRLQWLDISNNRITQIEDYTFRGLSLMHLFLNGNRNLNLHSNAFKEMTTTGLYLQECSFSQLEFEVFRPLNGTLQYLWLNGNELNLINKKFLSFFATLSHLRLGTNPFHCNCESLWLKEFYDKSGKIFQGSEAPSCLSPQKLRGKLFSSISLFDFTCSAPVFKNIDVVLEDNDKMLRCTAIGDPSPTLYWVSPTGLSIKYSPADINAKFNQAILNITALRLPKQQDISGQYFCLAINEAGNMTFTFNVSWPRKQIVQSSTMRYPTRIPITTEKSTIKSTTTISSSVVDDSYKTRRTTPWNRLKFSSTPAPNVEGDLHKPHNSNKNSNYNPSGDKDSSHGSDNNIGGSFNSIYVKSNNKSVVVNGPSGSERVSQRLYTLTELIGAVVGTLVCTLLLCLIIMPILFKKKWKRNRNNSLEKPPLKGDAMYLPPLVSGGNQYEGKITKTYRDYYFDSPSPVKR